MLQYPSIIPADGWSSIHAYSAMADLSMLFSLEESPFCDREDVLASNLDDSLVSKTSDIISIVLISLQMTVYIPTPDRVVRNRHSALPLKDCFMDLSQTSS